MTNDELIENGLQECTECDGIGHFDEYSDCCAARREPDLGLCYECKDHCEPMECDTCNGTGTVPYTEEDTLNDAENECISNNEMMKDI